MPLRSPSSAKIRVANLSLPTYSASRNTLVLVLSLPLPGDLGFLLPFLTPKIHPRKVVPSPTTLLFQEESTTLASALITGFSIFQLLEKSAQDVEILFFDHPSVISSPSKTSASSFENPIHFPPDLLVPPPPFP